MALNAAALQPGKSCTVGDRGWFRRPNRVHPRQTSADTGSALLTGSNRLRTRRESRPAARPARSLPAPITRRTTPSSRRPGSTGQARTSHECRRAGVRSGRQLRPTGQGVVPASRQSRYDPVANGALDPTPPRSAGRDADESLERATERRVRLVTESSGQLAQRASSPSCSHSRAACILHLAT